MEVVMKVKAAINVDLSGSLVIDDLDIGDPGPSHVIVKQFATGVCHSQLHQIHNPALPRPLVISFALFPHVGDTTSGEASRQYQLC
jgi:D-arabinose 1-dehydrogenase-like Zn-dependent alcohol dehydrogenase